MMQQVTTIAEKKDATKVAKSQLDSLTMRMTVAVLRKALSDSDANALTLWKVADSVCRCLRSMPQTDAIVSALYWANTAMAYDDDETLARFCLAKAFEALTC